MNKVWAAFDKQCNDQAYFIHPDPFPALVLTNMIPNEINLSKILFFPTAQALSPAPHETPDYIHEEQNF